MLTTTAIPSNSAAMCGGSFPAHFGLSFPAKCPVTRARPAVCRSPNPPLEVPCSNGEDFTDDDEIFVNDRSWPPSLPELQKKTLLNFPPARLQRCAASSPPVRGQGSRALRYA
jgi:hypothetical protein